MKKSFYFLLFLLSVAFAAKAQEADSLIGFPLVTTGWTVGGDATAVDSEIQLTGPAEDQSGYVYYSTPVNLTTCAEFTVEFDFQIIASAGSDDIADGIAFWYISNPPTGFASGGGVGLPSNPNGLITIMDSYNNNGFPDDNPLETLLYYNGTVPAYVEGSATGVLCPVVTLQSFITDGSWHHCKMTYVAGNINVYFNYSTTASLSAYHPISILGYFGFSSSTGLYYSTQSVKNITIYSAGVLTSPTVTSPVTYCQYAPATALTAVGTPLSWFTTDTATVDSITGAALIPNTTVLGTTTYYVREGTGTCESPPDSVQVIVSAQPAAPVITGDTFYCAGTPFVPISAAGTDIQWYTTAPGSSGSATAPVVNTSVPGTYKFYATQSTSGCESPRDSITIIVRTTPAAPILVTGQHVYCQFASFVPFTETGMNNLWYTTASGGTGTSTAPVINTSSAAVYHYYVSQTDSSCESPRLSVPVTVNPQPAEPTFTTPVYCQGDVPVALTAVGTSLLWYGGSLPTSGTSSAPTPSTATAGMDSFYVTQTLLGCPSDSALDTVIIKPKPLPPVTADTSYCQFFSAPVLTAIGSNLVWYLHPTGGSALTSAPRPSNTLPGDSTWYVSQTVNGCESYRAPLTVNTVYLPKFVITPSNPSPCQYDSINIAYTGPALTDPTYNWVLPVGAKVVDETNTSGTPSIVVQFDSADLANYVYLTTGNLGGECITRDSILIHVVTQPYATSYTKPNVCVGDTVTLALATQSANAYEYTWRIDGVYLANTSALNIIAANSNSGGPYQISWADSGLHIIQLNTATVQGCQSLPKYDSIYVHAAPDAAFTYKTREGSLCLQDSVLFKAVDDNETYAYAWSPAESFNNNNKSLIWGRLDQNVSRITLTVTDPFGCAASTTMELDPGSCCTVAFPNAFTPGSGANINKLFRPIAVGYHSYHMFRINNRWGQLIFSSENSDVAWDGNFNGVPQDGGVYFYYISFDCGGKTVEQKGDVTLIR